MSVLQPPPLLAVNLEPIPAAVSSIVRLLQLRGIEPIEYAELTLRRFGTCDVIQAYTFLIRDSDLDNAARHLQGQPCVEEQVKRDADDDNNHIPRSFTLLALNSHHTGTLSLLPSSSADYRSHDLTHITTPTLDPTLTLLGPRSPAAFLGMLLRKMEAHRIESPMHRDLASQFTSVIARVLFPRDSTYTDQLEDRYDPEDDEWFEERRQSWWADMKERKQKILREFELEKVEALRTVRDEWVFEEGEEWERRCILRAVEGGCRDECLPALVAAKVP